MSSDHCLLLATVSPRWPLTERPILGISRVPFAPAGDPQSLGFLAGQIEQTAHIAHPLQDARRHPADQRRVDGVHVMSLHCPQVAESAPIGTLARALAARRGNEYHVGIAREHGF